MTELNPIVTEMKLLSWVSLLGETGDLLKNLYGDIGYAEDSLAGCEEIPALANMKFDKEPFKVAYYRTPWLFKFNFEGIHLDGREMTQDERESAESLVSYEFVAGDFMLIKICSESPNFHSILVRTDLKPLDRTAGGYPVHQYFNQGIVLNQVEAEGLRLARVTFEDGRCQFYDSDLHLNTNVIKLDDVEKIEIGENGDWGIRMKDGTLEHPDNKCRRFPRGWRRDKEYAPTEEN